VRLRILIGVAAVMIAIVIGAFIAFIKSGATLYISGVSSSATISGNRAANTHFVSQPGLKNVIERLLKTDKFDSLWISTDKDQYSGLMLEMDSSTPALSIDFKTHRQQAEIKVFKLAMESKGFSGTEDSSGFNGGSGEEYRCTTLEYPLPSSADSVMRALNTAFAALDPKATSGYFVIAFNHSESAWNGPGIKLIPNSDPLRDLH